MTQTARDLVLAAAFVLAYPVGITLTEQAASDPTEPVPPMMVAEGSARP